MEMTDARRRLIEWSERRNDAMIARAGRPPLGDVARATRYARFRFQFRVLDEAAVADELQIMQEESDAEGQGPTDEDWQ